ncbi:hypothetical protein ACF0H5_001508 [Mactra antiquata]
MDKLEFGMCFIIFVLFSYAVADSGTWNQTKFEEQVVEYINSGLKCHNNPGFSVAVVKNGSVVLTRGFGYKTLDKSEPVTENTLFGIASLTKAFTATLILKQIEDNETMSLSTTLRSLFGRDDIFKSELRSRYATIEDLLAHRIGLPSYNYIRYDDTMTRRNLIDRIKYLDEKGGFRTSFNYSNLMYGMVTYLSEIIGGKSWEELIAEKIFSPLGMTSSTFASIDDPKDLDLATGHMESDFGDALFPVPFELSRHWGELCGSGCILSNAVDMSKWMMFHLNNKEHVKYTTVLKPESLKAAHTSHNNRTRTARAPYYSKPSTPVTLSERNYGLAWTLGYYRGFPMWTHSGSTYGYVSLITLLPDKNVGVFTTMTGPDPGILFRTNIHTYIADLALGVEPWMNRSTVCTFPEPWYNKIKKVLKERPKTDIPAIRVLDKYTGVFKNHAYGSIDVYKNKTSSLLMVKYGFAHFILYPQSSSDHFYAEGFGLLNNIQHISKFIFKFDEDQMVRNLTIPGFESNNPPVFQRITLHEDRSPTSHSGERSIYISDIAMMSIIGLLYNIKTLNW